MNHCLSIHIGKTCFYCFYFPIIAAASALLWFLPPFFTEQPHFIFLSSVKLKLHFHPVLTLSDTEHPLPYLYVPVLYIRRPDDWCPWHSEQRSYRSGLLRGPSNLRQGSNMRKKEEVSIGHLLFFTSYWEHETSQNVRGTFDCDDRSGA